MQTSIAIDGIQSPPRLLPPLTPRTEVVAAGLPMDVVTFQDRRGAARFVPVAATQLATTLATLRNAAPPAAMPLPLAAAAAAVPATASPALRIASDLQGHGFQLLYKRRFYIPLLMNPYVTLDATQFAARSEAGSGRLAVATSGLKPVAVKGLSDLQALDAFYLGGTACAGPAASLISALGSMYRDGYTFSRGHGDVGPYGAYVATTHGRSVKASRYGDKPVTLRSATDAARVELFRVGSLNPSPLPHAAEGQTLQTLETKQSVAYFASSASKTPMQAEQAWQQMFGDGDGTEVWAGVDGTPLVALSGAELADPTKADARLSTAISDYRQMINLGIPPAKGRDAWRQLSAEVAGESFDQRLDALHALIGACGKDGEQALEAYVRVSGAMRSGDTLVDSARAYADVRGVLGPAQHKEAVTAWLRMRDHLDEALPGALPADEKRHLYLELLAAVQHPARVEQVWRKIDNGVDSRAEQVDVFTACHQLEKGNASATQAAYSTLVALREPKEKLSDVLQDFAAMRRHAPDHDPAAALRALEMARRKLGQAAPGPQTDAQRRKMFDHLLDQVHDCDTAIKVWSSLGSGGPATEFEARLQGWETLFAAENQEAWAASHDFSNICGLRQAGESIPAVVNAFTEVRARLGPKDTKAANDAFRFIRADLDRSLAGPWSAAEKKDMYLRLLGALHDHSAALSTWQRLGARGTAPADFPQRLSAFVTLLNVEQGQEKEARRSFDLVLGEQRPGEALADTVKAYVDVRRRLPGTESSPGRAAFRFIRRDLAATVPGPWTTEQREGMYIRVLEASRSQETAQAVWPALVGGKKHTQVNAEFPQRLEAFHALCAFENNAREAVGELDAIDEVRAKTGEKLDALVADFLKLRPLTGNSTGEGILLFQRIHGKLADTEKAPYLRLQQITGSLYTTDQAWGMVRSSKLPIAAAANLFADSLSRTRSMQIAADELEAVAQHLRPNETVAQAAAALDTVRQALPVANLSEAAMVFRHLRNHATPAQEGLFLNMVRKAASGLLACNTWSALACGPEKTFNLRTGLVIAQPPAVWPDLIDRMKKVDHHVPRDVDHERGASALLFVAALPDAAAVKRVLSHLDETPGTDRTSTLEWLCGVMTAAGDVEGFDQAYADVHRAGAPGKVAERQQILAQLLGATRRSTEDGFDASLDFLRRLDKVREADFSATAMSAVALAGAMQGHAADAERAFEYILDAREEGSYASETLDATLTRFATLYAACQSVEKALTKLDQAPGGGKGNGSVERQDDGDVIIGGVRVPRAKKPTVASPTVPGKGDRAADFKPSGLYTWFLEQLEARHKIHPHHARQAEAAYS